MKIILRSIKLTAITILATAAFVGLTTNLSAADHGTAKGGAALLLPSKPIKTTDDAAAVKPGDLVVMSCPKCKNIAVKQITVEKGHIEHATTVMQHQCPGCGSKLTYTGHGKMKQAEWTHVCTACGSKDAFCCATKPGAAPTPGMEK
jgi:Zn finger protein HypA/HybF involved in hydrogenase expression